MAIYLTVRPVLSQCPPPCPPVVTLKLVLLIAVHNIPRQFSSPELNKHAICGFAVNAFGNVAEVPDLQVPHCIYNKLLN